MRLFFVLIVLFAMQLTAQAHESADLSSSASPAKDWPKGRDMFVNPRNEAKVKAMIDDLLREKRPTAPSSEDNSVGSQAVD